jgi:hypothetical protein
VTKVESILAADGKTEEKKAVAETPPEAKTEASAPKEQQTQMLGVGPNKGTWASMFKK